MGQKGAVNLPLHGGKAPPWLFRRMVRMSGAISEIIVNEYGQNELLRRISDPYWFQALACTIGFDWHSSGTTTTTCGALKESVNKLDLGVKFAGGKGKYSRNTLGEIEESELSTKKIESLKYNSKMVAKTDSALIQDGYGLYHHSFVFNEKGKWGVVQQGMNDSYARRYHWLSDNVKDLVNETNSSICCESKGRDVLNMTAKECKENQKVCVDLIKDNPAHLKKYMKKPAQSTLNEFSNNFKEYSFSPRHSILNSKEINFNMLQKAHEYQPKDYKELVSLKGVGAKTVRGLALVGDLVYGKKVSWEDPVKYSFAHGGKDGYPYPVNRKAMDNNINFMKEALSEAKIGRKDKLGALKRLKRLV